MAVCLIGRMRSAIMGSRSETIDALGIVCFVLFWLLTYPGLSQCGLGAINIASTGPEPVIGYGASAASTPIFAAGREGAHFGGY